MERAADKSENESDDDNFGSRVSIISKKKKRKKKEKSPQHIFTKKEFRTRSHSKGSDMEYASNSNPEDEKQSFSKVTDLRSRRQGLQKNSHVKSIGLEEITENKAVPKVLDVVVDVHYEQEGIKPLPRSRSSKNVNLKEESPTNKLAIQSSERSNKMIKNQSFETLENDQVIESLDAIEEVEEKSDRVFEKSKSSKKSFASMSRSSSEDKEDFEVISRSPEHEDGKRPARKRWSKDTSIIELPGRKKMSSSSPIRLNSNPIPAPRTSKKSIDSVLGIDNAAFESDHEDVLRIETDYNRKSTKIEMRKMNNQSRDEPSFFIASRHGREEEKLAFAKKSNEDTVLTIEQAEESEKETVTRVTKKKIDDEVLTVEESENTDSNLHRSEAMTLIDRKKASSRKKQTREEANFSSNGKDSLKKMSKKKKDSKELENRQSTDSGATHLSSGTKSSSSSRSSKLIRQKSDDSDFNCSSSKERRSQSRRRKNESSTKHRGDMESKSLDISGDAENVSMKRFDDSSDEDLIHEHRSRSRKSSRARSERCSSQEILSTNGTSEFPDNGENLASVKKKKKKKKKPIYTDREKLEERSKTSRKEETSSSIPDPNSTTEKKSKMKRKRKEKKEEEMKFISITIHRSDFLEIDYVTKHPMVKVHIVEAGTGNYLKNENSKTERAGSYLQPMMTGQFDFKENKSLMPIWEEELIFEHDFQTLTRTGSEQVIIFFEIVDLLSFAEASFNYNKFGNEGCWYKVAWAFLKPIGVNNAMHTDKKVRLQLYRPRRSVKKTDKNKCEVYSWWKSKNRDKYPSSIFVTVTSTDPRTPDTAPHEQLSLNNLHETHEGQVGTRKTMTPNLDIISLPKWTRLAAQSCKIPNEKFFETEASENGSFFIAFSNNGKFLACVNSEEYDYPIVVYEVESGKIHVQFSGHKTFVYSINWSSDDNLLLSVSSDQTGRLWDVQNKIIQHIHMLPHPSYVYCGKFDPTNSSIVATGCYDRVARIWAKDGTSEDHELSQELEGHEGFVNSMCFQADSNLITADSVGVIILWKARKSRRAVLKKEWQACRVIKAKEVEGITINTIVLHPLGSRLLVHTRNNELRMLDLNSGAVLQRYHGLNNQRIQTTACISPCGGLILCGDEDSALNVWHLETGRHLAKYTTERNLRVVTCVDYHPYDHVLAFSTFGSPAPVRVLRFNKDADGQEVGLKLTEEISAQSVDIASSFLNLSRERSRSSSRRGIPGETAREGNSTRLSKRSVSHGDAVQRRDIPQEDAKTRLQRFNDTEQILKSKSASRLYRIIEKIDRILSNNSRSPDDLEAGLSTIVQEDSSPKDVQGEVSRTGEANKRRLKSSKYSNEEDTGNYAGNIEVRHEMKSSAFELQELSVTKESVSVFTKRRPKSANESRVIRTVDDDAVKTFSDSAANFLQEDPVDIMRRVQVESSFIVESRHEEGTNSKSFRKSIPFDNPSTSDSVGSSRSQRSRESNSKKISPEHNSQTRMINVTRKSNFQNSSISSPDSAGTYVVEKADFERNDDVDSSKVYANKHSSPTERHEDHVKALKNGSDSSIHSNATFVMENEKPVPKPRKKKLLN